ncbi:MAG: hypothetical protein KDB82_00755 [Planctomycetes bacterium]|nr:hypothetical protein [Planctomycetota bacterium]
MIYGYSKQVLSDVGLLEMSEVSFELPPKVLRELARFLVEAADELESGERLSFGWHRHASAAISDWPQGDDVVVLIPQDAPNRMGRDEMPYCAGDE